MMTARPDISIITICYNSANFIDKCIDSVIDQMKPSYSIEHVIIDGGSSDGTVNRIRAKMQKNPHIVFLTEQDNGQSDAMNKGLGIARSEVVSFLNVDDYYEPGALELAMKMIPEFNEPFILIGDCRVVDKNGKELFVQKPSYKWDQILLLWKYKMPNNPSSYFYSKSLHSIVGNYDVEDHYAMDYGFLIRALKKANIYRLQKILGNYRYYEGTKTHDAAERGSSLDHIKYALSANASSLTRIIVMLHHSLFLLGERKMSKYPKTVVKGLRFMFSLIQTTIELVLAIINTIQRRLGLLVTKKVDTP